MVREKVIWYLHGFESAPGGDKPEWLESLGNKVYAPDMIYKKTNRHTYCEVRDVKHLTLKKLLFEAQVNPPDLIIGSSMGGYYADVLGSHLGVEVLLFNPALHNRPIDLKLNYGKSNYKRHFIVGENDKVIPPAATKVLADISDSWITVPNMGHRTPLNIFKDIYKKVILNETN